MTYKLVDTDGGGDYATLNSCLAAQAGDWVTATDNLEIECTGGTADSAVSVSGYITSAEYNVKVYAKSGDEALKTAIDTNRYRISATVACLQLANAGNLYITFQGIQILSASTAGNNTGGVLCRQSAALAVINFQWCRISKTDTNVNNYVDGIQIYQTASTTVNVFSCIIEGFSSTSSAGIYAWEDNVNIFGTLIYGCTNGIKRAGGDTVSTDNVVFGNTTDFSGTITGNNNASDDGGLTDPIAPSGSDWANEYPDYATGDWTLSNGGNCFHGGIDVTGMTYDIDGNAYYSSTPSVGPDEFETTGDISGTITTDSTLTGTLKGFGALASALNTSSSLQGLIKATGLLQGSLNTDSALSGLIKATGLLQGSFNTDSSLTGNTKGLGRLSGEVLTESVLTGTLTYSSDGAIQGISFGESVLSATLKGLGSLSGALNTSSELTAIIKATGNLSGQSDGLSTLTGTIDIFETNRLSGQINTESILTGTLKGLGSLSGLVNTESVVTGKLINVTTNTGLAKMYLTVINPSIVLEILQPKITMEVFEDE